MRYILDIIGFGLIGGTIYSFLGMPESVRWPVFWACAGGVLIIIIYRKKKKKPAT